ncbi:hypothetical protein C4564_01455 [Candidatus Microgenomates bacterium]|nr:MAG: hypothetical protein C4564_01455 [Candidatus Microgenomates bacterium]
MSRGSVILFHDILANARKEHLMFIRNSIVSLGAWYINCLIWAVTVMIGMVAISPKVNLEAHLIIEGALLAFWLILPYSVQTEDRTQTKLLSRIFSGHFVALAGTLLCIYMLTYVVGVVHILESFTITGGIALAVSYIIATVLAWQDKQLSPAKCILVGLAGPVCLTTFVGILKMAVTLTTTGSLAFVAIALLFFLTGFITDMAGEYNKPNINS